MSVSVSTMSIENVDIINLHIVIALVLESCSSQAHKPTNERLRPVTNQGLEVLPNELYQL